MTKHVPNILTSLNLFTGAIAITLAFEGHLLIASSLIALAAIFDFLDGMSARALKAYSNIGKELDSLADMVSFGVLPSVIIFQLMKQALKVSTISADLNFGQIVLLFSPFIIAVFSGLRLAKFNVDTRQTESFIGLATPANAFLLGSLPLVINFTHSYLLRDIILNPYFLVCLSVLVSLLLIAEIPMFSLKFKSLKFADNKIRYIFLGAAALLIIFGRFTGLPFIIIIYILLSVLNNLIKI